MASAYMQWLFYSGERIVAHGLLASGDGLDCGEGRVFYKHRFLVLCL